MLFPRQGRGGERGRGERDGEREKKEGERESGSALSEGERRIYALEEDDEDALELSFAFWPRLIRS